MGMQKIRQRNVIDIPCNGKGEMKALSFLKTWLVKKSIRCLCFMIFEL
jgi:hypothetical protein